MHVKLLEKSCRVRIARNHAATIFRPNNEYWKLLCTKIINGALQGGPRYFSRGKSYSKKLLSQNHVKSHGLHISGQITNIGSGRGENYKRSAPGRVGILACAIGQLKKVAVLESREIA